MDNIILKKTSKIDDCKKLLQNFSHCLNSLQNKEAIDFFSKKFSKYANVVLAETIEKKSIGFIAYYANNLETRIAFISMIAILPEYRGRHIGQSLLDFCKKDVIAKAFSSIKLEVSKNNYIAQQFYRKNGFIPINELDMLTMEWRNNNA